MVSRKNIEVREKKPRERKVQAIRKSFDVASLPDAVVDGKLVATPNSSLLVTRQYFQKTEVHDCTLWKLDEKFQIIEVWDETAQQVYCISLKEALPEVFKIKKMAPVEKTVVVTPPQVTEEVHPEPLEDEFVVKL